MKGCRGEFESASKSDLASLMQRRFLTMGPFFGPILCIITAVQYYFFHLLEWWDPRGGMDIVNDKLRWNHDDFVKVSAPKS
jgi:hypothetical protein